MLGPKLREFEIDNNAAVANEYFLPAPAGESSSRWRLTREFWLLMLLKFRYLLP